MYCTLFIYLLFLHITYKRIAHRCYFKSVEKSNTDMNIKTQRKTEGKENFEYELYKSYLRPCVHQMT